MYNDPDADGSQVLAVEPDGFVALGDTDEVNIENGVDKSPVRGVGGNKKSQGDDGMFEMPGFADKFYSTLSLLKQARRTRFRNSGITPLCLGLRRVLASTAARGCLPGAYAVVPQTWQYGE